MANKGKIAPSQAEANVGEILSRSERFIETYRNLIITVVAAIIIIVVAILGARQYYFLPKEKEAQEAVFPGENYLMNNQWELALNGDSLGYIGFLGVIDEYGITKTAKLAEAYAGICYYHLGKPEEALTHLNKFNVNDKVISPSITGLIGDCHVDMGELQEGIKYFNKAASKAGSELLSPIYLKKSATVYIKLADYKKAIEIYNTIKNKYPNSVEANDIDKYIDQAAANIK
ncbi:MAG: tetratricopeptide repeat protein [Candidatus Symbiothrix sp.]|jgi:tetratricopeptide (TPR) repeat protein|nr:tetratricopeptide repeat protein [Candidatus Symbiothrix sp.]